jgi:Alpha-L-fucosidase C-terminal domain
VLAADCGRMTSKPEVVPPGWQIAPEKRATGETVEAIPVRFTQKDSAVYATLLGSPKTASVTLKALSPAAGSSIYLLGNDKPLVWSQQGQDIQVTLPSTLPGQVRLCASNCRPGFLTEKWLLSNANRQTSSSPFLNRSASHTALGCAIQTFSSQLR